jgi:hypothetical protein
MSAIKATWQNGQVLLDGAPDWPDGRRLIVIEERPADIEFMTEDEQSDDSDAIERWIEHLRALPAVTMMPEQESEMIAWRKKAKEFNLQAVRRRMEEGVP